MQLSPATKDAVVQAVDYVRFGVQWGFVPFVIYLGFKKGPEPMPNGEVVPFTIFSLLWG